MAQIYFDPQKKAYVDPENGAIIPIMDGDCVPDYATTSTSFNPADHISEDYRLAQQLSMRGSPEHFSDFSAYDANNPNPASPTLSRQNTGGMFSSVLALIPPQLRSAVTGTGTGTNTNSANRHNSGYEHAGSFDAGGGDGAEQDDDWSLARALQAMEFEISNEAIRNAQGPDNGDFDDKEYRASACRRQALTFSTVIVLAQIAMMIVCIQKGGYAPISENPMLGPPAVTLVHYGAKEAGLIILKKQWWRLVTPIFLHAGIFHILSNIIIQLRVGGYLNCVYGTFKWTWIYFASGIFGNMFSCIFLTNDVGVGSSGALLGILTSWVVWIVFRWNKIPEQCHGQRNCQLAVVVGSIAITLGFSFTNYVDWAAHIGGAMQGLFWGAVFLSNELDVNLTKTLVRAIGLAMAFGSYAWAIYYLLAVSKPIVQLNDDDYRQ